MTKAVNLATVGSNANSGGTLITSGTAVASTSGTSIDFTGIPSWAKRITVMYSGISTSATSDYLCQLGDSGGIETSGYLGHCAAQNGTSAAILSAGFTFNPAPLAAGTYYGQIIICLLTGNTWTATGATGRGDTAGAAQSFYVQGSKTLSDVLTQIRITTTTGTPTFDLGSINILYE